MLIEKVWNALSKLPLRFINNENVLYFTVLTFLWLNHLLNIVSFPLQQNMGQCKWFFTCLSFSPCQLPPPPIPILGRGGGVSASPLGTLYNVTILLERLLFCYCVCIHCILCRSICVALSSFCRMCGKWTCLILNNLKKAINSCLRCDF